MMPTERFDRQLPELLTELAAPRTPDYLDDLLWQTANTTQRPAWSFLERWLPMLDVARQPVVAPPMPWRTIGFGFVLLALLIAMLAAIAVGTRPNPPAPFGPARNGLVLFEQGGDIFAVDAVTGDTTPLVTGPETDLNPRWSRDGMRFAFERKVEENRGLGLLYVANAHGIDPIRVTPDPLARIVSYEFSPSGQELLISASPGGIDGILVAAVDGSRIRQLDTPQLATNARWRPPDGSEILFTDRGDYTTGFGSVYAMNMTTGKIRIVQEREPGPYRAHHMWSPDGSRIAYVEWVDSSSLTAQTHIMAADGTSDRVLPIPEDAIWQAALSWSNDGNRLLAIRGYTGDFDGSVAVVVPADSSGFGVEFGTSGAIGMDCCTAWEWAPDDTSILGTPTDAAGQPLGQVLLDPVTGTSTAVPWSSTSHPTWQRLAR